MKIIIKQISLRNFKGAKNVQIEFDERLTNITGDNRAGKTTIFDAFSWLMFGKNSENSANFSIKTLDSKNNSLSKLEHEVEAVLLVDGVETVLKRVYKEKWTKKRGSETEEFTGHQEEFYLNDVPKSLSEYNSVIDGIFNSSISRMITDPMYFNEVMSWTDRRAVLMKMAGDITEESILLANPELDLVQSIFLENKTIEDKKKELAAKKTKVKESIESIPARLDEIDRSKSVDLRPISVLESTKTHVQGLIDKNLLIINDKSSGAEEFNNKRANLIKEKGRIEGEIEIEKRNISNAKTKAEDDYDKEIQSIKQSAEKSNDIILNLKFLITEKESEIKKLRTSNEGLKAKYDELNSQTFDTHQSICPACSQELPIDQIEIKKTEFNNWKSGEMESLKAKAVENNNQILIVQGEITLLNNDIVSHENTLKTCAESLEKIPPFEFTADGSFLNRLNLELDSINAQIDSLAIPDAVNNDSIIEANKEYNKQIDAIKQELFKHESNEKLEARKQELIDEQRIRIKELGDIERFENQIAQFIKLHIEAIEASVNGSFEGIRFKMFEQQVNGGEKPTCICLVDGVPYPDVNTADQINAGLQIIKTLQNYYQRFAPVFIDNRERVSKIIEMDCQIINLTVVKGQEKLLVS